MREAFAIVAPYDPHAPARDGIADDELDPPKRHAGGHEDVAAVERHFLARVQ